jgi:alpha-L-fucosidase
MKRLSLLIICLVLAGIGVSGCEPAARMARLKEGLRPETEARHDERMAWWRDAKFGMFIHWGVYSVPAGEWNGTIYPGISEWIMSHAMIPIEEYETLLPKFNPDRFDAKKWVKMAKSAGMKYIVITSKHHDGFAIYDSKISDYDIVDSTGYGRDILKALSRECEKAGIRFCTYYSILDWHHQSQEPRQVEIDEDEEDNWEMYGMNQMKPGRKDEYKRYMSAQLREIVTQYDPAVMWFDGGWTNWWTVEDGKEILNLLWSLNPDMVINNRATEDEKSDLWLGDYGTPEQHIPDGGLDYDWETCMTMNDSWGYKRSDSNWKPTKVLIFNLIDIASKGGNFLLNVGPTDKGLIPQPSVERLKEMGDWLDVNGQAIYGTSPWRKRKEGPTDVSFINSYEGDYADFVEPEYTAQDICFTAKDDTVYAICLTWPEEKVHIKSLGERALDDLDVVSVSMLGIDDDLKWEQRRDGLTVVFPDKKPCKYAYVLKIKLKEE